MAYLIEDLLDDDDFDDDFVCDGIDGLPFQDDDEWVNDRIDGLPFQDDDKWINDGIDGMGFPESTQAMFITESLHDIKELIKALGGDGKTILSFAGFGDLLLTCTSTKSRNFRFGLMIGEGRSKKEIQEFIDNTTIEGLYTLKSIHKLVHNKKVNIPIIDLIYDIVFNDVNPNELKKFLIEKV